MEIFLMFRYFLGNCYFPVNIISELFPEVIIFYCNIFRFNIILFYLTSDRVISLITTLFTEQILLQLLKICCFFQQFFPTRDRQWYAVIKEVQERNQAADTAHMKSSLELSGKLQAAEISMLHGIPVSESEKSFKISRVLTCI